MHSMAPLSLFTDFIFYLQISFFISSNLNFELDLI